MGHLLMNLSRLAYYSPILGYHRIGPAKADHVPTVSPEAFERQLSFLTRHRYQVVSLNAVADALERGTRLPQRQTVITFDDGYEETYTIAWPLLKRFGFSSTVFITPGEIGTPGFMTWEQAIEMSHGGVTIGNHTMHHTYLPEVPDAQLPNELIESKRVIEEHLRQPVEYISYPIGGFTVRVQEIVRQAGYRAACTTNRVSLMRGIDRFAIRRVKITERDGAGPSLWVKLSGYYDLFRQLKAPS